MARQDRERDPNRSPHLVVLAAGMGSRFGGIKQLHPFTQGRHTLLEFSIYDAARLGLGRIILIIRREMEESFHQVVTRRLPPALRDRVRVVYQELTHLPEGVPPQQGRVKPWGTAHALWCAAQHLDRPFAVINADDFYSPPAFAALWDHLRRASGQGQYCMVGYPLRAVVPPQGAVSRGLCQIDTAGHLRRIQERTGIHRGLTPTGQPCLLDGQPQGPNPIDPQTLVSMNCWGFTPDIVGHTETLLREFFAGAGGEKPLGECYIPTAVDRAITAGEATCAVLTPDVTWAGVTSRDDIPAVEAYLQELIAVRAAYPPNLWAAPPSVDS